MLFHTHPFVRFAKDWPVPFNEFEARSFGLALDVAESPDGYTLRANLPGARLEDIDISIHDGLLTITAEAASEKVDENSRLVIRERRSGKFTRSLRFPVDVQSDAIAASFDNGVLNVFVPKAEQVKPRQIPVNVPKAES